MLTPSQEDMVDLITNNNFETTIAAAYTIHQASLEGTKKHAMAKEEFAQLFMDNIEDFRTILTRIVERKQEY